MNLELFFARRMLKGKQEKSVSVPLVRIALIGIILGVCVMLLSIFIITGFKQEITYKLTGFSAHLNVVAYGHQNSYAAESVRAADSLLSDIRQVSGVKKLYRYVTKPAILKNGTEIHGIGLYGVDSLYDADFFQKNLKEGKIPDFRRDKATDEVLLSETVANFLKLKTGDKVNAYFVQDPPRVRVFRVAGIYATGFKEYDETFVLGDIRHLQRLNAWTAEQVTGIAVELEDLEAIPKAEEVISDMLPWEENESFYKVETLYEIAPQVFEWLALLNTNIGIILTLLIIVAGFNMVSGLLILILDRTAFIGILKALGYKNFRLRRLFLYISMGLIGRGILWGNVAALVLGGLQYQFHIIHLDPSAYYMDTVPISFNVFYILLLDLGVWIISTAMLVVPTVLISRINPIKAIRFE